MIIETGKPLLLSELLLKNFKLKPKKCFAGVLCNRREESKVSYVLAYC